MILLLVIGWFDNEEWLKYNIDVKETAKYKVTFQVAFEVENSKFAFFIDDNMIKDEIIVNKTGS